MKPVLRFLDDCLSVVYPRLCVACQEEQPPVKEIVCTRCHYHLPATNLHLDKENSFTERFWGRIPIRTGAAIFQFSKDSKVQKMLHNFKYKGNRNIGLKLGQQYGQQLHEIAHFEDVDCIVPVPLHWKKLRTRGFNQSEVFAKALAGEMKASCISNALTRVINSASLAQSGQSRSERLEQIKNAFVRNTKVDLSKYKHILLVDDVLTTGATLEACASQLRELGLPISMATIAMAAQ